MKKIILFLLAVCLVGAAFSQNWSNTKSIDSALVEAKKQKDFEVKKFYYNEVLLQYKDCMVEQPRFDQTPKSCEEDCLKEFKTAATKSVADLKLQMKIWHPYTWADYDYNDGPDSALMREKIKPQLLAELNGNPYYRPWIPQYPPYPPFGSYYGYGFHLPQVQYQNPQLVEPKGQSSQKSIDFLMAENQLLKSLIIELEKEIKTLKKYSIVKEL